MLLYYIIYILYYIILFYIIYMCDKFGIGFAAEFPKTNKEIFPKISQILIWINALQLKVPWHLPLRQRCRVFWCQLHLRQGLGNSWDTFHSWWLADSEVSPSSGTEITFWLVVYLPLWKIWKSVGIILPNIWKVIKFMFQTTNQLKSLLLCI